MLQNLRNADLRETRLMKFLHCRRNTALGQSTSLVLGGHVRRGTKVSVPVARKKRSVVPFCDESFVLTIPENLLGSRTAVIAGVYGLTVVARSFRKYSGWRSNDSRCSRSSRWCFRRPVHYSVGRSSRPSSRRSEDWWIGCGGGRRRRRRRRIVSDRRWVSSTSWSDLRSSCR